MEKLTIPLESDLMMISNIKIKGSFNRKVKNTWISK